MRAVLDTNVVVSALIWGGKPIDLLQAAVNCAIQIHDMAHGLYRNRAWGP